MISSNMSPAVPTSSWAGMVPADTRDYGRALSVWWRDAWVRYVQRAHSIAPAALRAYGDYTRNVITPLHRSVRTLTPAQLRERSDLFAQALTPVSQWFSGVIHASDDIDSWEFPQGIPDAMQQALREWMHSTDQVSNILQWAKAQGHLDPAEFEAYMDAAQLRIGTGTVRPDPATGELGDFASWRGTYLDTMEEALARGAQALRGMIGHELELLHAAELCPLLEDIRDDTLCRAARLVIAWNAVPEIFDEYRGECVLGDYLGEFLRSQRHEADGHDLDRALCEALDEFVDAETATEYIPRLQVIFWRDLAEQIRDLADEGVRCALRYHNSLRHLRGLPAEDETALLLTVMRVQDLDAPVGE